MLPWFCGLPERRSADRWLTNSGSLVRHPQNWRRDGGHGAEVRLAPHRRIPQCNAVTYQPKTTTLTRNSDCLTDLVLSITPQALHVYFMYNAREQLRSAGSWLTSHAGKLLAHPFPHSVLSDWLPCSLYAPVQKETLAAAVAPKASTKMLVCGGAWHIAIHPLWRPEPPGPPGRCHTGTRYKLTRAMCLSQQHGSHRTHCPFPCPAIHWVSSPRNWAFMGGIGSPYSAWNLPPRIRCFLWLCTHIIIPGRAGFFMWPRSTTTEDGNSTQIWEYAARETPLKPSDSSFQGLTRMRVWQLRLQQLSCQSSCAHYDGSISTLSRESLLLQTPYNRTMQVTCPSSDSTCWSTNRLVPVSTAAVMSCTPGSKAAQHTWAVLCNEETEDLQYLVGNLSTTCRTLPSLHPAESSRSERGPTWVVTFCPAYCFQKLRWAF